MSSFFNFDLISKVPSVFEKIKAIKIIATLYDRNCLKLYSYSKNIFKVSG